MAQSDKIEKLLWSVALPGFGHFLNRQYLKGSVLILLELIVNMGSNLNLAIIYSFQGDIDQAIKQTDFQWLMFYPCLYMFGIWDAYRDAGGGRTPFTMIPFLLAAFLATVGVTYSATMKVVGVLFGPVWLPMLFSVTGILTGILIRALLIRVSANY